MPCTNPTAAKGKKSFDPKSGRMPFLGDSNKASFYQRIRCLKTPVRGLSQALKRHYLPSSQVGNRSFGGQGVFYRAKHQGQWRAKRMAHMGKEVRQGPVRISKRVGASPVFLTPSSHARAFNTALVTLKITRS